MSTNASSSASATLPVLYATLFALALVWLAYCVYCYFKRRDSEKKFSDELETERAKRMLSGVRNGAAEIVGTRHSFSSMISNAKALDRRVQEETVIKQIQNGVRVIQIDVWLKRRRKTTENNRQHSWTEKFREFCDEKIDRALSTLFAPRLRVLTDELVRKNRGIIPLVSRAGPVDKKRAEKAYYELEPLVLTNGVRTDVNMIDCLDILSQCAERLDIERLFVSVDKIAMFDDENQRLDFESDDMVAKFVDAIARACDCDKFERLVIMERPRLEKRFKEIEVVDNARKRDDFYDMPKVDRLLDEETENDVLREIARNETTPIRLVWLSKENKTKE